MLSTRLTPRSAAGSGSGRSPSAAASKPRCPQQWLPLPGCSGSGPQGTAPEGHQTPTPRFSKPGQALWSLGLGFRACGAQHPDFRLQMGETRQAIPQHCLRPKQQHPAGGQLGVPGCSAELPLTQRGPADTRAQSRAGFNHWAP